MFVGSKMLSYSWRWFAAQGISWVLDLSGHFFERGIICEIRVMSRHILNFGDIFCRFFSVKYVVTLFGNLVHPVLKFLLFRVVFLLEIC